MAKELHISRTKNDVQKRLMGSICRYRGRPCFVHECENHNLYISYLDQHCQRTELVDYRVDEFDYSSPPLGYMNCQERAWYLSRIPDRHNQSQGLTHTMVHSLPEGVQGLRRWYQAPELAMCITGEHPSYAVALDNVEARGWHSCSFNRHVAVSKLSTRTLGLEYRGRLVGIREQESGPFRLLQADDRPFLSKIIKKFGVEIGD